MTEAAFTRQLNQSPNSRPLADEAVRSFPESALLWFLRGQAYWQADEDDIELAREAGRSWERAIQLAPNMEAALIALADYYDGFCDEPKKALPLYERAKALRAMPIA